MLNIDTLNNVIAVIVVILTLSLIVQSIQALLKKLFAIKSQQLEDSLVDLFEHVIAAGSARKSLLSNTPLLRQLFFRGSLRDRASGQTKALLDAVVEQFKNLGRVTTRGKLMLDSLSRDDLLKVLSSVAPEKILPGLTPKLQQVCDEIKAVDDAINQVAAADLPGEANAAFAQFRESLGPLLNDYRTITSNGKVSAGVVIGDLLSFAQQAFTIPLATLGKIQATVASAAATAPAPQQTALAQVSKQLQAVVTALTTLRTTADAHLAPLRAKLNEIGSWFDTVMQGFAERYQRGMKTWSIVISAVVVVLLNANIFNIYDAIAGSDLLRGNLQSVGAELLKKHQQIADNQREIEKREKSPAPSAPATATTTATTSSAPAAASTETSGTTPPKSTPAPAKPSTSVDDLQAQIEKNQREIRELVQLYAGFGFQPLSRDEASAWWDGFIHGGVDENGEKWIERRVDDVRTLAGWIVMVLLLSLGAPFWHDALESLFGVKNLLQQKTEKQNVETASGAGNPKP